MLSLEDGSTGHAGKRRGAGMRPSVASLYDILGVPGVLDLVGVKDACAVRRVARQLRTAIAEHVWDDPMPVNPALLARWRSCFPCACSVTLAVGEDTVACEEKWTDSLEGLRSISVCPAIRDDHIGAGNFSDAACASNAVVRRLQRSLLPALRRLDLCGILSFTDDVFAAVAQLEELRTDAVFEGGLSETGFSHLTDLRSLELISHTEGITISAAMLSRLTRLNKLVLESFYVNLSGPETLAMGLRDLRVLELYSCDAFLAATSPTAGLFDPLLSHVAPTLTRLVMHQREQVDSRANLISSRCLSTLQSLDSLDLSLCHASLLPTAFVQLQKLQSLSARSVTFGPGLRIVTDESLGHLPNLRTLSLAESRDGITGAGLRNLSNLRLLDISFTGADEPQTELFNADAHGYCLSVLGADTFTATPQLEELIMRGRIDIAFDLSCSGATVLAPLTHLRVLNVFGCCQPELGDEVLAALPSLEDLDISSCTQFTGAAFPLMRRLKRLRMDYCDSLPLSDAALSCLGGIVTLSMRGCVRELSPLITDEGWAMLANVRSLDVGGNFISEASRAFLRQAIPSLHGCGML